MGRKMSQNMAVQLGGQKAKVMAHLWWCGSGERRRVRGKQSKGAGRILRSIRIEGKGDGPPVVWGQETERVRGKLRGQGRY